MESIFKYMSFLGLDYFDNPTARISLIQELNDPFECKLSNTINPLIHEYTKLLNLTYEEKTGVKGKIPNSYTRKYLNDALKGVGVISFSETHRNLLMWAHYANNHSGICIELAPDWSKSKERLAETKSKDIHSFRRVQYDTQRVDFLKYNLSPEDLHESIVELFTKQLTLKSDEWLYEKEHRYIMTFLEADYIRIKSGASLPKKARSKIDSHMSTSNVYFEDNQYITTDCNDLDFFYRLIGYDSFMYLTKIPPEKIKGVYLGHRFKRNDRNGLINKLRNASHPLHHISVYQCSISDARFELNIKRIY